MIQINDYVNLDEYSRCRVIYANVIGDTEQVAA
jgi:hypothetical protein